MDDGMQQCTAKGSIPKRMVEHSIAVLGPDVGDKCLWQSGLNMGCVMVGCIGKRQEGGYRGMVMEVEHYQHQVGHVCFVGDRNDVENLSAAHRLVGAGEPAWGMRGAYQEFCQAGAVCKVKNGAPGAAGKHYRRVCGLTQPVSIAFWGLGRIVEDGLECRKPCGLFPLYRVGGCRMVRPMLLAGIHCGA